VPNGDGSNDVSLGAVASILCDMTFKMICALVIGELMVLALFLRPLFRLDKH